MTGSLTTMASAIRDLLLKRSKLKEDAMKTRKEEVLKLVEQTHKRMYDVFLSREGCLTWHERIANAREYSKALEEYVEARIEKAMIEKGYVHG